MIINSTVLERSIQKDEQNISLEKRSNKKYIIKRKNSLTRTLIRELLFWIILVD